MVKDAVVLYGIHEIILILRSFTGLFFVPYIQNLTKVEEVLQFWAQVRQLWLSSLTVYDLRTINIVSDG